MKKHAISLLLVLALMLALLSGCGQSGASSDDGADEASAGDYTTLEAGDEAPLFTAELADGSGDVFDMSAQGGKVVLINFWATWCPPCCEEMPAFEWLDADYGDEVAIIAVNVGEDPDTVSDFVSENGYTFPVALDEDGSVSQLYPTQGIPFTIIVGKDGRISALYVGATDAETQYNEYRNAIEEALGA